jgi:hypothetical protein
MKKKLVLSMAAVFLALVIRRYASIGLPIGYDKYAYFTAARYYADAIRRHQWERVPEVSFSCEHPALAKVIFGAVLAKFPFDQMAEN